MKILVFGANLAGRHGRGSAKEAVKYHGAIYGQGVGLQGNSYAIPTKDENLKVMPLNKIKPYVDEFLEFAKNNPKMKFDLVAVGCGLSGYEPEDIAPMFAKYSKNINLPSEFKRVLKCR
jgi:hypothetical protein